MRLISWGFLAFVLLTFLVYSLAPRRARWGILCAASVIFYLLAGMTSFVFVVVVSATSYFLSLYENKKVLASYAAVLIILSAWTSAKLLSERGSVVVPLGISFYSLRVISYLVKLKRGKISAERNFFKYLLFVSYFPICMLGPVAEYDEMSSRLFKGQKAGTEDTVSATLRVSWGIFKKTIIADALTAPLGVISSDPEIYSGAYTLFLLIFYSARIYCDFSGGMDIVLGVSRLFGIKLPENFDRPFSSRSLREFWNRWHITLGEWFEHYVFYPLSLSKPMRKLTKWAKARLGAQRARKIPVYTATMLTWMLTGLWHGARWHFLAWGVINGALVILSNEATPIFVKKFKNRDGFFLIWLGRIRVFLIIGAVRLLDVYESLPVTLRMLGSIFVDIRSYAHLCFGGLFEIIAFPKLLTVIFSLMLVFLVSEKGITSENIAKKPISAAVCAFALLLVSLIFGAYGEGYVASDFIYSRY